MLPNFLILIIEVWEKISITIDLRLFFDIFDNFTDSCQKGSDTRAGVYKLCNFIGLYPKSEKYLFCLINGHLEADRSSTSTKWTKYPLLLR